MAQDKQHPIFTDPKMKAYFNTLPPVVQETIEQSGFKPQSVEELKATVSNLMKQ